MRTLSGGAFAWAKCSRSLGQLPLSGVRLAQLHAVVGLSRVRSPGHGRSTRLRRQVHLQCGCAIGGHVALFEIALNDSELAALLAERLERETGPTLVVDGGVQGDVLVGQE